MDKNDNKIKINIESYLKKHEYKEILRFITCGSVDDGKSTLIGRLLYDSKMIYEDQIAATKQETKKYGTVDDEIDFALLIDGLQSEREQGITIDVAYRFFSTDKKKYIIADTPGHEQYTRNMVTGASTADLAIILVDARKGVLTQTRRHSFLVALLGIKNILVAINKMDLMDYSEKVYEDIKQDYLDMFKMLKYSLPYKHYNPQIDFIPISALKGDNVVENSQNMDWYHDKPLLNYLDEIETYNKIVQSNSTTQDLSPATFNLSNFRFPVQYVNRPNLNFRGFCGNIASGNIKQGDKIIVYPSQKTSTVKEIIFPMNSVYSILYDIPHMSPNTCQLAPNTSITLTFNDEIDISKGDLIVKEDEKLPRFSDSFEAMLVWMDEESLKNRDYILKIYTKETKSYVSKILFKKDVNTWEKIAAKTLNLNDIARVQIDSEEKIAFDYYEENKSTGSFILIDKITNNTVAAGMIVGETTKINKEIFTFNKWNELKQKLNNKDKSIFFSEREIWFANLGQNISNEQNGVGDEFLRPVIVFKKFNKRLFLAIPLTYKLKEGYYFHQIKFKNKINTALLLQTRVLDSDRLKYKIVKLGSTEFKKLKDIFIEKITPR